MHLHEELVLFEIYIQKIRLINYEKKITTTTNFVFKFFMLEYI